MSVIQVSNKMNSLFRVFVYGTLKRGEPNHSLIKNDHNGYAKLLGIGKTVTKYPLIVATIYNIPFLLKHPGLGHQVEGEVYEVDSKMLNKLDELEDHPSFYVRTEDDVELVNVVDTNVSQNSNKIRAWIYFLPKFRPSLLNETMFSCYSNQGCHGLEYINSNESSINDVL